MMIFWLVAMVVFITVEFSTVSMVSLWFAVGSLAALIVSFFSGPIWLQILLFLVVSGGLLAALRPLVRKYINPKLVATNVDSIIGTQGYVTEDIDNLTAVGRVKLGANFWSARSTDGAPIPNGTLVRVDRIEGNKVFVTPVTVTSNV